MKNNSVRALKNTCIYTWIKTPVRKRREIQFETWCKYPYSLSITKRVISRIILFKIFLISIQEIIDVNGFLCA